MKVESVGSCRFQIHPCIPACVVSSEFTRKVVMKFLSAQFSRIWCWCVRSNFVHSKIFQSDRIHWSYGKKIPAHYACRNADLNLILVEATTSRSNIRMINSLKDSWGERLTWLDRKCFYLRKQAIWLCWWHVYWHLFIFKGDTGPVGEMGQRGKDGNPVGLQLILLYFE